MAADREFGFSTRALHAGTPPDPITGARATPIVMSASYVFESTEHAANLYSLRTYGNIYSRISNPTVSAFEEKIASLEGGLGAVATSSGHAAQLVAVLSLAQNGDHIVSSANLYGGSVTQFSVAFKRLGIETTLVSGGEPDGMRAAIRPNTKALYVETIGNPQGTIGDIEGLAGVAHAAGVPLIVDNTFASPYLCRPIEHGADIVVHSATKFICGHGTVMAGVVVESGKFPWSAGKHPLLSDPSPGYHGMLFTETFGEYAFLMRARAEVLRDFGPCLSPFDAFLLIQGVETLAVRMERETASAATIAAHLEKHDGVAWVRYPGSASNPQRELVRKYLPRGAGSIFSFGLRGGRTAAVAFIESLQIWSHLANVGDAKSLVIHPASTTHAQLSEDEMERAGVTADMVRVSVGLEDVDDLIWDLDRALDAAGKATGAAAR